MTGLLALTSILLLVSGLTKIRSGARVGLGVHVPTLAEVAFAVVTGVAAVAGVGSLWTVQLMVPAGVALVVVSSVVFSLRMRDRRRHREALLSRRLETYVRYLHSADDPPEE